MRHIVLGTVLVALVLLHAVTHDEWREERERLAAENRKLVQKAVEWRTENRELRELAKLAAHSACFGCPHNDKKSWKSCEGCNIYEKAAELGVEV